MGQWERVQFQRPSWADAPDVGLDFVAEGAVLVCAFLKRVWSWGDWRVGVGDWDSGGGKGGVGETYLGP